MLANKIELRQEISESDAWEIARWLEDREITRYLNEGHNVSKTIKETINRVNMPVLTHLFNQNGSFFMVTSHNQPIGFLRLDSQGDSNEIVVVIGDQENWGKGFGYHAIFLGLKHAFFTLRKRRVIAKIHKDNERSKRVFKKAGFCEEKTLTKEIQLCISLEQFLELLKKG